MLDGVNDKLVYSDRNHRGKVVIDTRTRERCRLHYGNANAEESLTLVDLDQRHRGEFERSVREIDFDLW